MKKLLFLFLLFAHASLFAQDIIYKTDGTRVEAKVQEVGTEEIRYKLFNNPDGPVYVIEGDEITMIAYQNGTHETFNVKQSRTRTDSDSLARNKRKNIVSFNMSDIVFTNVGVSYERIFGKGYIGLKVPFSIGLAAQSGDATPHGSYTLSRLWGTGIDVNFYPLGQSKVTYYLGPSFIIGQYTYQYDFFNGYSNPPYYYPIYERETTEAYHFAFLVNNGIMIQATKSLNLTMALGLGMKEDMTLRSDYIEPKANFYMNMGYRF